MILILEKMKELKNMITLNYQTNNPRWGWSGMKFSSWESFAFTLGFLSNIQHYKNKGNTFSIWNNSISIHVEGNQIQGAWNKEGRIHYYKATDDLHCVLTDLFIHKSAGNNSTTCRINSNNYIYSLIYDFGFEVITYHGYTTADVFPPIDSDPLLILINHMENNGFDRVSIEICITAFRNGFNL